MTTINFVSKEEAEQVQISRARRVVMAVTSGVLAVYLIGATGLFGWWWYWSGKQKRTSDEADILTQQLTKYSEAEVTARKLLARAGAVNDFLRNQSVASQAAALLAGESRARVVGWLFVSGGMQRITVEADQIDGVKAYADYLGNLYGRVQADEIRWQEINKWRGSFLVSERKKT